MQWSCMFGTVKITGFIGVVDWFMLVYDFTDL